MTLSKAGNAPEASSTECLASSADSASRPHPGKFDTMGARKALKRRTGCDKLGVRKLRFRHQSNKWLNDKVLLIPNRRAVFQYSGEIKNNQTRIMAARTRKKGQKAIMICY